MIKCIFENGTKTSLRHVVVDILVIEGSKILLVKRAPHLTHGDKYATVGGFVERDETLEEAAKREVLEETGYKVEIQKLLRVIDNPDRPKEDRQNISFVYIATPLEKVGEPDKESTSVGWFDLDKLPVEEDFAFDHLENIKLYLGGK